MQSRSNKSRPAIQVEPYMHELRGFFADWGLSTGSPSNLAPMAQLLARPGSFRDEFLSMVSTVVLCEGGAVPRNELLALILTAIQGSAEPQTVEEDQVAFRALETFAAQVIQSVGRRLSSEEGLHAELPASTGAPQPALVRMPRPIGVENLLARRPEPLNPLKFNPVPIQPLAQTSPVQLPRATPPVASKPDQPSQPVKPPRVHLVPTPPRIPAELLADKPASPLPVNLPPDHFFRSTMWALSVTLAIVLVWRHYRPIETAEAERQSQTSTASDRPTPGTAAAQPEAPITATIAVSGVDSNSSEAPTQRQSQAGTQPTLTATQAAGKVSLPTGLEAIPVFPGTTSGAKSTTPSTPDLPRLPRRHPLSTATTASAAPAQAPATPSAPGKQGAFLVSSGVMSGNLIASPLPKYPRFAKITGVEGQVTLQAVVSRNGSVLTTHVVDGPHLLRGAAVKAVRKWRFRPHMEDGKPAQIATTVVMQFRLGR